VIADDLLNQSRHLARLEPRKPKQASLRRSVSTAYYAVFHLLCEEAAKRLVTGSGRDIHRDAIRRSMTHGRMADACKSFGRGRGPATGLLVSPDIVTVATAFVFLQDERHTADYDLLTSFTRARVNAALQTATTAFEAWRRARGEADADLLLLTMLLGARRVP
jgi:uncharacterized protein (UPF0332 family)